jgi:protein MAK16
MVQKTKKRLTRLTQTRLHI